MNPFPSAPSRPASYCVKASRWEDGYALPHVIAICFLEAYGVKHWLNVYLRRLSYKVDGSLIVVEDGSTLSGALDCIDYELRGDELRWQLPENIVRQIAMFRRATWHVADEPAAPVANAGRQRAIVARVERIARPERPQDMLTITQIAEQMNVLPRVARAILRGSGRTKPEYGWAFAPQEIPAIQKLIREGA
jgi:hypothetical protein